MKAYIETNSRYGDGYQVRVEDGGKQDVIDMSRYKLRDAVRMAKHAAGIIKGGDVPWDEMRGILVLDRDSIVENRGRDWMSRKMADALLAASEKGDTDADTSERTRKQGVHLQEDP